MAPSDIRGRHCSLTFPSLPLHVHDQRLWQSAVSESWGDQPAVSGAAFVDAELSTTRSLEGFLTPIIDGLTPCVGRDPRAQLEFAPNDHLAVWLRFRRAIRPTIGLRLGLIT